MSELTISAENIPFIKFKGITAGATALRLRIYCNQSFITGGTQSGKIVPAGAPGTDAFYLELVVPVVSMTWNSIPNTLVAQLPSFVIDSTVDGQNIKTSRYSAFFFSPAGKQLGPLDPFQNFAVPPATDTGSTGTWAQIATYNLGVAPLQPLTYSYSQEAVDRKFAELNAVSLPSGLVAGDLVTGSVSGMFARFPAYGGAGVRYLKETGFTLSWGTLDSADVIAGLGYTPVNKAGDTMSGNLLMTGTAKITLAVAPTDGSPDLDVASVKYVKDKTAGMGVGNLVSINGDITGAQTLVVDTVTNLFPNLVITDPGSGVHRFGFTGQLAVSRGGTSFGSYAVGDQLYASGASALSKLAIGSTDQVMIVAGGIPAWGALNLAAGAAVTGILPSARGGTGTGFFNVAGLTASRTITFPDADATVFTTASIIGGPNGGTGTGTYAIGDILAADSVSTLARVAGNTTTSRKFLSGTGNGTTAGTPAWVRPIPSDIDASGGGFSIAQGGTGATSLAAGYIKSNSTVLSSQAVPIPIADGGTNAIAFANTNGLVLYSGSALATFATGGVGTVLGGGSTPTWTTTPQANTVQLNSLTATGVVWLDGSKISAVDATNFFWDNTGKILNLRQGGLKISNTANDNSFTLKAHGTTGTGRTYTWPVDYPAVSNYSLVSDTSGNLSWVNISGGGGSITINGDGGPAFILQVGSSGSDFNIPAPSSGTITLNIPTASQTARGLVSTGTQSFGGIKTFLDEVSFTSGKVVTFGVGTTNAPSLIIPVGATLSSAQSGAIENTGVRLFYTNNSLARKSIAHLDDNITGSAASITGNLTGDVTSVGMTTSYSAVVPLAKGGTGVNLGGIGTEGQFLGVTSGAVAFRSDASQLTDLNATQLTSGMVPAARLTGLITNAEINASAAIAWSKIDKTGSSLADLSTRSASDLSSGTLPDARLSGNVLLTSARGAANGVASLDSGTKVPNAQIAGVLAITDTTTYLTTSGTGTVALRTTITSPTSGQVITWDGTNWVNQGMPAAGNHNILSSTHPDTNSGASSVAVGDLLYGNDNITSQWDRLSIGSADRVLVSTSGTNGVVPMWSQVNLTSMVTGTLPFASGGLGFTSGTSGGLVYLSASNTITSSGAMTDKGVMYGQGSGLPPATVTVNATATKKFLTQVSSGTPSYDTIATGDIAELLAVTDLSTYATASGTGTVAIRATFTSLTTNDVLTWDGSNWINQASAGSSPHDILSATHTDTVAATVVRGDLLVGNSTPKWARVAVDTNNRVLVNDGTDTAWGKVDLASGNYVTGILAAGNGGTNNAFTQFSGPATSTKTFTLPNASATILTSNAAVTVGQGGTGLTSGTSGGILGYTASGTLASSAALAANGVVLGGGAGATPTATSAGSANQVLRVPGGGGAPAFGAVDLAQSAAVTGVLDETNGGTGNSSYTKGDLLAATGASALGKRAVGTDGQFLMADSGQATGLAWADGGMSAITDDYVFISLPGAPTGVAMASSANVVSVFRFQIYRKITVNALAFYISTSAAVNGDVGVYSNAGSKLISTGSISLNSTGVKTGGSSTTLDPGMYWLAWTASGTGANASGANSGSNISNLLGDTKTITGTAANAASSGVLPSTLGSITRTAPTSGPIYVKLQN